MKQVIQKEDAQKRLLQGINLLGDTVGSTLGPSGRTVIYQRTEDVKGLPTITKDGVTVAFNVQSSDPVENVGINLVRDAARKTAIFAGDGTTTSTVLVQEILNKGFETDIKSPREFVMGMEKASEDILKIVEEESIDLTPELLKNVATISANNNETLGEYVSSAYEKAGEFGYVGFEYNDQGHTVEVDLRDGTILEGPCLDSNFYTNRAAEVCEQDNPLLFISYGQIDNVRQLEPIFEKAIKENRPLTVIADCDVKVYQAMAMNVLKHQLRLNAVKPNGIGIFLRESLEDLAAVTGATLHGPHLGDAANTITPDMLGTCKKLTTTKRDTLLEFDERGPKTKELAEQVQALYDKEKNEQRRETLKKRLASLLGKFAIIKVGANSQVEMNEKYDLVEDAVKAVHSAKQEGIVPGGGNTLRYAADINKRDFEGDSEDYIRGYESVIYAARRPFQRILENADLSWKQQDLQIQSSANHGVDATSGRSVNLIESGIVDPTYVIKQAIENSISVAKTVITSSATIINIKDE